MSRYSMVLLLPCICLAAAGCDIIFDPGEYGQSDWHDDLGYAQDSVIDLLDALDPDRDWLWDGPRELFSDGQLDAMISRKRDGVVSAAELMQSLNTVDLELLVEDLTNQLDQPGVREALGLGDSTVNPVDETLPGEFWVYDESLHFSRPLSPDIAEFYKYVFYVYEGRVGAASFTCFGE
jgi:hypothetical protein